MVNISLVRRPNWPSNSKFVSAWTHWSATFVAQFCSEKRPVWNFQLSKDVYETVSLHSPYMAIYGIHIHEGQNQPNTEISISDISSKTLSWAWNIVLAKQQSLMFYFFEISNQICTVKHPVTTLLHSQGNMVQTYTNITCFSFLLNFPMFTPIHSSQYSASTKWFAPLLQLLL